MKRLFSIAVLLRGAIAVIAQGLLVRELLVIFFGNELTFSLMLGEWLIFGACGSILASYLYNRIKNPAVFFSILQLLSGVWLTAAVLLIRFSRMILAVPFGEVLSLGQIAFVAFMGLSVSSFLDGAMFTIAFRSMRSVARLYLLECIGSLLAGLLMSFVLLKTLNGLQISLLVTLAASAASASLLKKEKKRRLSTAACFICLAAVLGLLNSPALEKNTLERQWKGMQLIFNENSVYGNIAVTKQAEQSTIFYDGLAVASLPAGEGYFIQDFVHIPMLSVDRPESALFLGGAAAGLLAEAEKYPLKRLAYAEQDALLIKTLLKLDRELQRRELDDKRLDIIRRDGREYLKSTKETFSIIFVNTATATSLRINRYMTKEFFKEAREHLSPGGILALRSSGSLVSLSPEMKTANASLLRTASSVFSDIRVVPGDGYNIILASERPLKENAGQMAQRMRKAGVHSSLLSAPYLEYRLDSEHEKWFLDSIKEDFRRACVNDDLKPCGLFDGLQLYYSQFSRKIPSIFKGFRRLSLIFILPAAFFLMLAWSLYLRKTGNKFPVFGFTVFSSGFFCMGMQMCVIFLFQSALGYIFNWLSVITAFFMAGGAAGALIALKNKARFGTLKGLSGVEFFASTLSVATAFLVILMTGSNGAGLLAQGWAFALISAFSGALAGIELPSIYEALRKRPSEREEQRTASWIYGLDLAGACAAAFLAPLALIPSLGIGGTILLLWSLKIMNGCNLAWQRISGR